MLGSARAALSVLLSCHVLTPSTFFSFFSSCSSSSTPPCSLFSSSSPPSPLYSALSFSFSSPLFLLSLFFLDAAHYELTPDDVPWPCDVCGHVNHPLATDQCEVCGCCRQSSLSASPCSASPLSASRVSHASHASTHTGRHEHVPPQPLLPLPLSAATATHRQQPSATTAPEAKTLTHAVDRSTQPGERFYAVRDAIYAIPLRSSAPLAALPDTRRRHSSEAQATVISLTQAETETATEIATETERANSKSKSKASTSVPTDDTWKAAFPPPLPPRGASSIALGRHIAAAPQAVSAREGLSRNRGGSMAAPGPSPTALSGQAAARQSQHGKARVARSVSASCMGNPFEAPLRSPHVPTSGTRAGAVLSKRAVTATRAEKGRATEESPTAVSGSVPEMPVNPFQHAAPENSRGPSASRSPRALFFGASNPFADFSSHV